jgi:hypothetical protein
MSNKNFYTWFSEIKKDLGIRSASFTKIFEYLDTRPDPIIIVETGCLRKEGNFSGDGQSTLIFDKYTQFRGKGSKVYTVDINPEAIKICKKVVSENVECFAGDSVSYLSDLTKKLKLDKTIVSLFFLDSFDVNWKYPYQSSAHHLKELTAVIDIINKDTLIVIDDAPIMAPVQIVDQKYILIDKPPAPKPYVSGKAFLVHEYAMANGAKVLFSNYQTAWIGFKKN